MRIKCEFLILFAIQFDIILSYKILGVFPINGRSHYLTARALMKGLVDAGHEVTIASPFMELNPLHNYKQVQLTRINKYC